MKKPLAIAGTVAVCALALFAWNRNPPESVPSQEVAAEAAPSKEVVRGALFIEAPIPPKSEGGVEASKEARAPQSLPSPPKGLDYDEIAHALNGDLSPEIRSLIEEHRSRSAEFRDMLIEYDELNAKLARATLEKTPASAHIARELDQKFRAISALNSELDASTRKLAHEFKVAFYEKNSIPLEM